jgi:hypothetical protein
LHVGIADASSLADATVRLVYRAARELLRNVIKNVSRSN